MTAEPRPDPIDEAIAATATQPKVQMFQGTVTMPSGRPAVVGLPADLTEAELRWFIGWLSWHLPDEIVKARAAAAPNIVVAKRGPILVPDHR